MDPYNSLEDPHLYGYFANDHRRKELRKAGLIGKQGEVITEATYRLNAILAEKGRRRFNGDEDIEDGGRTLDENGRRVRRLPKVNMPSEDFCRNNNFKYRSSSSRRYLSPLKSSSYDRIKSAPDYVNQKPYYTTYQDVMTGIKNKYPWSTSSPYLWPQPIASNDLIRLNVSHDRNRCSGYMTCSALPAIGRSKDDFNGNRNNYGKREEMLRLSGTLHIFPTNASLNLSSGNSNSIFQRHHGNANNNFITTNNSIFSSKQHNSATSPARKRCLVTMRYYGDPIRLNEFWSYRKDDVTVEQQHCGGNTLIVFRGKLAPESEFTFPSMRRRDFPFSLTIYIEHQQNTRISVCCEAKHRRGVRLGGNNGCFGIVDVENPIYCESCRETKRKMKVERKKQKTSKEQSDNFRMEEEDNCEDKSLNNIHNEFNKSTVRQKIRKKINSKNRTSDQENYEDDFENGSDTEKLDSSTRKKIETHKLKAENPILRQSLNSPRSTESETSKSPVKALVNKTHKMDKDENIMDTENIQLDNSKQSEENKNSKTLKFNSKKEKRFENKDKKLLKRKSSKNIEADKETKQPVNSQIESSVAFQKSNKYEPSDTNDDTQIKSPENCHEGKMNIRKEGRLSANENDGNSNEIDKPKAPENESGDRGKFFESDSTKPQTDGDRKKEVKEYERRLRETAKDCVAEVYRSLEAALKEENGSETENKEEAH